MKSSPKVARRDAYTKPGMNNASTNILNETQKTLNNFLTCHSTYIEQHYDLEQEPLDSATSKLQMAKEKAY